MYGKGPSVQKLGERGEKQRQLLEYLCAVCSTGRNWQSFHSINQKKKEGRKVKQFRWKNGPWLFHQAWGRRRFVVIIDAAWLWRCSWQVTINFNRPSQHQAIIRQKQGNAISVKRYKHKTNTWIYFSLHCTKQNWWRTRSLDSKPKMNKLWKTNKYCLTKGWNFFYLKQSPGHVYWEVNSIDFNRTYSQVGAHRITASICIEPIMAIHE